MKQQLESQFKEMILITPERLEQLFVENNAKLMANLKPILLQSNYAKQGKEWLSAKEFAAAVGVNTQHILAMCKKMTLPSRKGNGANAHIKIHQSELANFLMPTENQDLIKKY